MADKATLSSEDPPYTPQYRTIMGTGHTRPTQEIGAPTLIWHVAVWPRDNHDPQDVKPLVERFDVRKLAKRTRRGSGVKKQENHYLDAVELHNRRRNDLLIKIGEEKPFGYLRELPDRATRTFRRLRTNFGKQGNAQEQASPKKGRIETLNDFLSHLKEKGRTTLARDPGDSTQDVLKLQSLLNKETPSDTGRASDSAALGAMGTASSRRKKRATKGQAEASLLFSEPESIGFTLWWQDGTTDQHATELPGYDPLRVRVQVETQIDYFAITFLIDVGKPWNVGPVFSSNEAPGDRRRKIFRYVEEVRKKCDGELTKNNGSLEEPLVPLDRVQPPCKPIQAHELPQAIADLRESVSKKSVKEEETKVFLEAAKYLYGGVWNEFCKSFDFEFHDIPGDQGRVFANFRGLVMSTPGMDEISGGDYLSQELAKIRRESATPGKGDFRKFDPKKNEPNAVVKAYWPFVRRIKPYADYREYIACGVFDWRALYITALGSRSDYDPGDESIGRDYEIPSGNLPELPYKDDDSGALKVWLRSKDGPLLADDPTLGPHGEEPVRYLLLTKYEPHRRQLGRIIDRINALGTMRLFALKSYDHIRDASEHVRMRGQELDQIVATWIEARREIERKFGHDPDKRNAALSTLNELVELQLIEISAGLDNLGKSTIGGLPYRIARSRYFAERFNAMTKTLEVRNIQSWTSYEQFATRGLQPVFEFIASTGHRLRLLRQRLSNVMQTIQTSALVSQSEETRKNTRELEKLQTKARGLTIAAILAILIAFLQSIANDKNWVMRLCDGRNVCRQLFDLVRENFGAKDDAGAQVVIALCIAGALMAVVLMRQAMSLRWGFAFFGTGIAVTALIGSPFVFVFVLALIVWLIVHLVLWWLRMRM